MLRGLLGLLLPEGGLPLACLASFLPLAVFLAARESDLRSSRSYSMLFVFIEEVSVVFCLRVRSVRFDTVPISPWSSMIFLYLFLSSRIRGKTS
jgi:uncharacterized membrane protein